MTTKLNVFMKVLENFFQMPIVKYKFAMTPQAIAMRFVLEDKSEIIVRALNPNFKKGGE